jgi:hypothetical protein
MSMEDAEERIMLGGKVSSKHQDFKKIAMMDPKTAFICLLLENLEELQTKNPLDQVTYLLELKGKINFMSTCTELTKLSAILGDTRQKYSQKGLKDELTRKFQEST